MFKFLIYSGFSQQIEQSCDNFLNVVIKSYKFKKRQTGNLKFIICSVTHKKIPRYHTINSQIRQNICFEHLIDRYIGDRKKINIVFKQTVTIAACNFSFFDALLWAQDCN